jgi:hypothetical protein
MSITTKLGVFVAITAILGAGAFFFGGGDRGKVDSAASAKTARAFSTVAEAVANARTAAVGEAADAVKNEALPSVFGLKGTVNLADVPEGTFRHELTRLAKPSLAYALAKLGKLHVPLADVASLRVDGTGHLYYECAAVSASILAATSPAREPDAAAIETPSESSASVPVSTPPVRHSKAGASKVIYLDFNGYTITGTHWNLAMGSPGDADYRPAVTSYVAKAFSLDADLDNFSDAEQTEIIRIWERVAEDYRPFDVDVTTEEPASFTANTGRILITNSTDANGVEMPGGSTAAGIAYLDVFGSSDYVSAYSPALIYADKNYNYEDYIAEAASHEMGHNLSLSHDGKTDGTEYYLGHGSGPTSWGPLMGAPYNRNVTQWSKGEYYLANNQEDDLALIAGHLGYAAPTPADNNTAANPLTVSGSTLSGQGVIGTPGEADRFSFTVSAISVVSFTALPFRSAVDTSGGNLDVALQLYDAGNTLVANNDPANATTTSAILNAGLSPGTYYLRVSGEGAGTPMANPPTGYTAYDSMGQYTISGSIAAPTAPAFTVQPTSRSASAGQPVTFSVTTNGNPAPSIRWQRMTNGASSWLDLTDSLGISGSSTVSLTLAATTGAMNGDQFRCVATNVAGSVTSNSAVLTVNTPPSITTQPLSSAVFAGGSVIFSVSVSGGGTSTYQWQKNGINIAGATSATLNLTNIQVSDAGNYALVATNAGGSTTSRFARLVVLVPQANATVYNATVYPTGVTAGGNVGLDYVLTNIGTRNWDVNHYLSIRDNNGTFVAFSPLIGTHSGENKTVHLSFTAPTTPGTYPYVVQGLENGVEFFSTQVTFTLYVLAQQPNSITYNATNFPVSATPGSNLIFNYNVTNTGTKTWGTNHFLTLRDNFGSYAPYASLNGVAPGQSKTVNLSLTAPATPGIYPYYVQALENTVQYFQAQADLTLTVLGAHPNAVIYTPTRSQDNVVPGATVSLRYSLSNAGTGTWGANRYASLRDSNGTFLAFVPLSGVAPGGSTTVNFNFTAPTAPGIYSYFVQNLEDGVEFFDSQDVVTLTVLTIPIGNAASYNTSTFPASAARGATVTFTENITNRGTKTWGANHYLSLRDADNIFLGFLSLNGLAPGQSKTLTFIFTAPAASGVYTYHVQGFESGIEFFNMSDNPVLIVP